MITRYVILASVLCLLLGVLSGSGNAQLVFVDPGVWYVCVDSITGVDVRVDALLDSIHSYAFLMYIDTTKVFLDSVSRGAILDHIFGQYDTVWFGWEYNDHFPDSLYFGASIFGYGTFVNGPGQLGRIWIKGKRAGQTPVAFGWCILRDPYHPSGPGMPITKEDGLIIVFGPGIRFGDVNADGRIELGDVVYLINYLYKSGSAPLPWWFIGDTDCNKLVDLGDLVYLINYLYKSGAEPCHPCG
jgi:hypothetical protein